MNELHTVSSDQLQLIYVVIVILQFRDQRIVQILSSKSIILKREYSNCDTIEINYDVDYETSDFRISKTNSDFDFWL